MARPMIRQRRGLIPTIVLETHAEWRAHRWRTRIFHARAPDAGDFKADDVALRVENCFSAHSDSHLDPERGCVVQTSRSTSARHQAVMCFHALRLMLRTQPRSAK